jgi:transposase
MEKRRPTALFSSSLIGAAGSLPHGPLRIKHFRGLATRYEKDAANFLAMLKLAATNLWLDHTESVT